MIVPSRRGFITGLVGLIAAPAIVKASSLMPVYSPRVVSREEFLLEFQREVLRAYIECYDVSRRGSEPIVLLDRKGLRGDFLRGDGTLCAAPRCTA